MDQIVTTKRIIEDRTHKFYCDECGKFLGESTEYSDGYYEKFGEVPRHDMPQYNHILGIHIKLSKTCLCDECLEKKQEEVREALGKLGFIVNNK